jgi:hypothetical protein
LVACMLIVATVILAVGRWAFVALTYCWAMVVVVAIMVAINVAVSVVAIVVRMKFSFIS